MACRGWRTRRRRARGRRRAFAVEGEGRLPALKDTLAGWIGHRPVDLAGLLAEGEEPHRLLPPRPAGVVEHLRLNLRAADGSTLQVRVSQTGSADGRLSRALVRDRAQEAAVQQACAPSGYRFHRMFDQAPIGIVIVDRDGRVREANAAFAAMLGTAAETFAGRPLVELFDSGDRTEVAQRLAKVIAGSADRLPLEV